MRAIGLCVAAALLAVGCTTYQDTKRNLQTGYYQDLQVQADRDVDLAKDQQISLQRDLRTLQQKQASMSAENAAVAQQLASIDADLSAASRALDQARDRNKVDRAQYDKLRAEIDQLRLEQQKDAMVSADPAAKQRQIEELQRKKQALQKVIQDLGKS
jgi:chromosome segregation ATPase